MLNELTWPVVIKQHFHLACSYCLAVQECFLSLECLCWPSVLPGHGTEKCNTLSMMFTYLVFSSKHTKLLKICIMYINMLYATGSFECFKIYTVPYYNISFWFIHLLLFIFMGKILSLAFHSTKYSIIVIFFS